VKFTKLAAVIAVRVKGFDAFQRSLGGSLR